MGTLNRSQQIFVLSTFEHVDQLLRGVEHLTRAELSAFACERADLSRDEARLLLSFVTTARERMLRALDRLGIERPRASASARWSAITKLSFVDIDLSELSVAKLRGFGQVDDEAGAIMETLATDLRALVRQSHNLLGEHNDNSLHQRLARLPGVPGEVLRTLSQMSSENGLVEIRSLLEAAAERAESTTFDVGVFGRVNSGKSSLINALVGQDVLPVGATPVTAVPVRLWRGPLSVIVRLTGETAREATPAEIARFVSEEGNPDNKLGVESVDVQIPTAMEGLRLLDTPGVGSIATVGAAQAYAWLPRCDLGLVLIAAGTAVTHDDLALVSGLVQAGIACTVFLSKCDLLREEEVAASMAYLRAEFTRLLGPAAPVDIRPLSILPGAAHGLETYQENVLGPLALRHRDEARLALAQRLRRLVAATGEALEGRGTASDDEVFAIHRQKHAATRRIREIADGLGEATREILASSSRQVAHAWRRSDSATAAVQRVVVGAAHDALAAVTNVIGVMADSIPEAGEVVTRRLPPIFDAELDSILPPLHPPRLGAALFGEALAARRLAPVEAPLSRALSGYARQLYAWGTARLDELPAAPPEHGRTSHAPQDGELARLDALLARVASGSFDSASPTRSGGEPPREQD